MNIYIYLHTILYIFIYTFLHIHIYIQYIYVSLLYIHQFSCIIVTPGLINHGSESGAIYAQAVIHICLAPSSQQSKGSCISSGLVRCTLIYICYQLCWQQSPELRMNVARKSFHHDFNFWGAAGVPWNARALYLFIHAPAFLPGKRKHNF